MHHLTPSHPHHATRTVTLPPSCTTLLTLSYKHQIRSHLHLYTAHTNTHAAHIQHSHTCANTHARTCTHMHTYSPMHTRTQHTHTHTHYTPHTRHQHTQHTAGGKDNESAEDYFKRIMEETGTLVLWPSRLKIGAKSKKGRRHCSTLCGCSVWESHTLWYAMWLVSMFGFLSYSSPWSYIELSLLPL